MAILEVRKGNNRQLQNIANTLAAAKKVVVITGAGISTNCGISDEEEIATRPLSGPVFIASEEKEDHDHTEHMGGHRH